MYSAPLNNSKRDEKYSRVRDFSIAAGYATYKLSPKINDKILFGIVKSFVYKYVDNADVYQKKYDNTFNQAFESCKLSGKGLKVATDEEMKKDPNPFVRMGKDAHYNPVKNKIYFNRNNTGTALSFHELGHAVNFNSKGLGRFLFKARGLTHKLALFSLGCAMLKPSEIEDSKNNSSADKISSKLKKYCGVLGALSFLPIIVEEGRASMNGIKLAKSVEGEHRLSKPALKVLKNIYKRAFAFYIIRGLFLGLSVMLAGFAYNGLEKLSKN